MMPEKEKGCSWSRIFFRFFSVRNHNRLCVIGFSVTFFRGAKVAVFDATWLQLLWLLGEIHIYVIFRYFQF